MVSNVKHDHCYTQQSVEKALAQERIKNRILEDKYEASQKCIKALREKLKRRDQENKDLLLQAREQRLLETDQCEMLKANLSAEAQELFLNEKKNNRALRQQEEDTQMSSKHLQSHCIFTAHKRMSSLGNT